MFEMGGGAQNGVLKPHMPNNRLTVWSTFTGFF